MTDGTAARGLETPLDERTVALRIKVIRQRQGKSLRQVAGLAGISAGHLSRIEHGVRKLDSLSLLRSLASALGVTAEQLTRAAPPANPANPAVASGIVVSGVTGSGAAAPPISDGVLALLPPIRAALDMIDLPPDETSRPRSLSWLAAGVRRVNRLAQSSRYERMARILPDLLGELHTAAHSFAGHQGELAWGLLAEAARCGHSVGIAVGLPDLSAVALQRMDWAASRAGDRAPALRALREYLRVTAYLRARDYQACRCLTASGMAKLDGTDTRTPDALVARGQLHLGASVIAAHSGDMASMREHLAEAGRIAAATGERTERLWVGFGPTNVEVHRVMALACAGEHGRAVEAGERVRFPADWLPNRIGHHHLDMARAWRWLAKPDKALEALLAARAVAPGQARRHPLARETVTGLLRSARRPSGALREYAAWLGAQS